MSIYHAVLLDTVSIQQYIFQSNYLKDNLGASFLVGNIYKEHLENIIKKIYSRDFDFESWKKNPSKIQEPFDVGYVGGGNALLLFTNQQYAKKFLKEWTKTLLLYTPGITTAVALNEIIINLNKPEDFIKSKKRLFDLLQKNKSEFVPQTIIPKHGITAECRRTGLSLDVQNNTVKDYVSIVANSKINAARKAKENIHEQFKDILKDQYCFSDDLEKIGSIEGEDSHIAIVHIDGNNMGDRFKVLESFQKIRELSITVDKATQNAFRKLLNYIVSEYNTIMKSLGFDDTSPVQKRRFPVDSETGKNILPIRPIILGGDDITFVSDGKLGIYFSKLFIEAFEKEEVSDRQKLTACAGIAIIKSKYPFYRGVQLAEELCYNAKTERRKDNSNYSYIDFHISTGGLAGSLEVIRKKNFTVNQGNLLYRPFKLVSHDLDKQSFDLVIAKIIELKQFPNNKIHELRQVLTLSKNAAKQFVQQMKYRGKELPIIPGQTYHFSLFENNETPYFDMIELLKFYPEFALQDNGGKR